jgi:hypothetical protein
MSLKCDARMIKVRLVTIYIRHIHKAQVPGGSHKP